MTGPARTDLRKSHRPGESREGPGVEVDGDVWRIRSLPLVRAVLRASAETTQAGFNAELATRGRGRRPVLFMDGAEHRQARQRIARYFAPRVVQREYRDFMATRADELVAAVAARGGADLSDVTMRYSVEVAAQVLGLGEADMAGMSRRLSRFFTAGLGTSGATSAPGRLQAARASALSSWLLWRFYRCDVRPAIRARRARPTGDVVSHLIQEGYQDVEILTECLTYGAAGMVTTREFIQMSVWHLLEHDDLRATYLGADREGRHAVLAELLRLEPVVGHLYRRAATTFTVDDGETRHTVPAGTLLDLDVRGANADETAVGPDPLGLCPGRDLPPRTPAEAASFGDGYHRCPGNHIAIEESDAFLTRLLALPIRLVGTPAIRWDDLISGYEVRGLRVALDPALVR